MWNILRAIFKQFWNPRFLLTNLALPLAGLVLYCSLFFFIFLTHLPAGVNEVFVGSLLIIVVVFAGITMYATLVAHKLQRGVPWSYPYTPRLPPPVELFLLLLPLTPVVQYLITNQNLLHPLDALVVLAFFLLLSGLVILVLPVFLGDPAATRLLKLNGLALIFMLLAMPLISHAYAWYMVGNLKVQLLVFGGIFLVAWLLDRPRRRWILYLTITSFFLSNTTTQWIAQRGAKSQTVASFEDNALLRLVADRQPIATPNIYLLVYDAYLPGETMLANGIDNSTQEAYLVSQGFTLYPRIYSIGMSTVESMSKVLNVSTEYYGNPRRAVSGNGVVQYLFHSLGYKVFGVFPTDYMFRGIGSSYDFLVPENITPTSVQLSRAILVGEFRFDLGFKDRPREQYLQTKQDVLSGLLGSPLFLYTHSDLPTHSQNSGVCLPNEAELYAKRLALANVEMTQDVETVIEHDPQAIIIVAGDHGPLLTKNCIHTSGYYDLSEITRLDIQDRYATFLAIRWPGTGSAGSYDRITVLQDLFPVVFAYMYQDPTILGAEIDPTIPLPSGISGATVSHGAIQGGANDGEPLFLSGK